MSDLIRAVRAGWTPQPRASFDVRVVAPADPYSFFKHDSDAQSRETQRQVNRTIRAANLRSLPTADRAAPLTIYPSPNVIITMPVT